MRASPGTNRVVSLREAYHTAPVEDRKPLAGRIGDIVLPHRRNELRLVFLSLVVVLVPLALQGWELYRFSRQQIGIVFSTAEENRFEITDVVPGSPADQEGILAGDRILRAGDIPVEEVRDVGTAVDRIAPEERLTLLVEREGEEVAISLRPGAPFPYFNFTVTALTVLTYLLIGPLALFKRPGYLRAQLLFLLTTAIALEVALPGAVTAVYLWAAGAALLAGFQMSAELHLASVIPERQSWLDRLPWAVPGYYALGLSVGVFLAATLLAMRAGVEPLPWPADTVYDEVTRYLYGGWALAVLFLLGRQAFRYPEAKGRQQAALVFLGVVPWALLLLAFELGLVDRFVPAHWQDLAWNLALLPYPLAVFVLLLRDTANQERVLLDLIDEVKLVGSVSEISRIVGDRLHEAFHPKTTGVFYRRRHSRDLALGHSTGVALREEVIPENSSLLRLLEAYGRAADYPSDLVGIPPGERAWLEELEARLLVPLAGRNGRLLGLLVLGEKKSEEPYTPRDRRLLQALTSQIALVYENARLKDKVDQSEQIQRDVLNRLADDEVNLVKECPTCGRCYDAGEVKCEEDGRDLLPSQPVERVVEGRYRLDRRIDRGGMGAIYRATDLHLDRPVAVKVLLGALATPDVVRRFEKEARLTARLRHPNVVTVHDYGSTTTGAAYLVMELLEGTTLAAALAEGPVPPDRAAEWFGQACEGLLAAHREGIVHRDLKPANLFLAKRPEGGRVLKILDFGVAKVRRSLLDESADLTAPGSLVGSFRYMSPEQIDGTQVDERSDLFALATVVVEALTGSHPFPGENPGEVARAIRSPREGSWFGDADQGEIDRILRRALEPDPDRRYDSIHAFEEELIPALRRLANTSPT